MPDENLKCVEAMEAHASFNGLDEQLHATEIAAVSHINAHENDPAVYEVAGAAPQACLGDLNEEAPFEALTKDGRL